MPHAISTVEVKIKWVLDGDGVRAIDSATGAVRKLIRNEQELADATAKANRELLDRRASGPAGGRWPVAGVDQPAGSSAADRHAEAVRRELGRHQPPRSEAPARRETVVGLDRPPAGGGPPAAIKARFAPGLNADDLGQQLARAGGSAEGLAGVNPLARLGGGSLARLGGSLAAGGPVAAGLFAAKTMTDEGVRYGEIVRTPFMGQADRKERYNDGLGFGIGRAIKYKREALQQMSGDNDAIRQAQEFGAVEGLRAAQAGQYHRREDSLRREAGGAGDRAAAFAGLKLDRVTPGLNREAVAGERQFQDESRLLGVRRQLTLASKERAAADAGVSRAVDIQTRRQEELAATEAKLEKAHLARDRAFRSGSKAEREATAAAVSALETQRGEQSQTLGEARAARRGAEQSAGDRAAEEARAKAGVLRGRAEQAEERAAQADDKSVSLSRAGVGGRETAKVALQMAKEFGVDNLPPELRGSIGAVAPDTLKRLEREDGDKYKDDFKGLVDEGERGFTKGSDERKKAGGLREEADRTDEGAIGKQTQAIADSYSDLAEQIKGMTADLNAVIEKFRSDMQRAAIQP